MSLLDGRYLDSGGFIGKTVFGLSRSFLGGPGSVLTLFLLLFLSLMISTRFSPYSLGWFLVQGLGGGLRKLTGLVFGPEPESRGESRKDRRIVPRKARSPQETGAAVIEAVPGGQGQPRVTDDKKKEDGFDMPPLARGSWKLPALSLLKKNQQVQREVDKEIYYAVSQQLEEKLGDFGVSGKVVGISPGPVVTTYEYAPAPGIKINKIVGLADDLALGLKAQSVRAVALVWLVVQVGVNTLQAAATALVPDRYPAARRGEPREAGEGRGGERRDREGRGEIERPGDRGRETRLGDAQHDGRLAATDLRPVGLDQHAVQAAARGHLQQQVAQLAGLAFRGPRLLSALGDYGLRRVQENFDWIKILKKYEQTLGLTAPEPVRYE